MAKTPFEVIPQKGPILTGADALHRDIIDILLDALDKARNLDDLIQSLTAQKSIIEALLILLE